MASLIKDKTITFLKNSNNGNTIFNKLMSSLKNSKDANLKKSTTPLSVNNLTTLKPDIKEEKSEKKEEDEKNQ